MTDNRIATLDEGRVNERILAKEAKADFRRVEEAGIKYEIKLTSPEAKRLFVRCFLSFQLNVHFISTLARMKLPSEAVEKVEAALRAKLDEARREFDRAIDGAEALFKEHGITKIAIYQTVPLDLEVSVISSHGRRYFDLFSKLDQMMPILKTLEIEDLRSNGMVDKQRAAYKRLIIGVQSSARGFAAGLRRRMNEEDAPAKLSAERAGEAAAQGSAEVIRIESAAPGVQAPGLKERAPQEPLDDSTGADGVDSQEAAVVAAS